MKKYSDEITFTAKNKCPTGFDSWTFYWTFPEIDDDARLEYKVLKPNGRTYSHWKSREHMKKNLKKDTSIRSDFGKNFEGGDPECFYKKKLMITFIVDKGKIIFTEKNKKIFRFEFRKTKTIEVE